MMGVGTSSAVSASPAIRNEMGQGRTSPALAIRRTVSLLRRVPPLAASRWCWDRAPQQTEVWGWFRGRSGRFVSILGSNSKREGVWESIQAMGLTLTGAIAPDR